MNHNTSQLHLALVQQIRQNCPLHLRQVYQVEPSLPRHLLQTELLASFKLPTFYLFRPS